MDGIPEEEFSQETAIRSIMFDTIERQCSATQIHVGAMGLLRALMVMGNGFASQSTNRQICLEGATLATAAMACEQVLAPCVGLSIVKVGSFQGLARPPEPPEEPEGAGEAPGA